MTPSEFKAAFPEFTSETDQRVQMFIDNAEPFFDLCRWGDQYFEGVSNYVAHKLAASNARAAQSLAGGAVGAADDKTMKKVGDLQVMRSAEMLLANSKDPFMTTVYGQEYRRLMKVVGAGISAV